MSKLYYAVRHINLKMLHKAIKKACLRTLGILKHAEGRARLRYLTHVRDIFTSLKINVYPELPARMRSE